MRKYYGKAEDDLGAHRDSTRPDPNLTERHKQANEGDFALRGLSGSCSQDGKKRRIRRPCAIRGERRKLQWTALMFPVTQGQTRWNTSNLRTSDALARRPSSNMQRQRDCNTYIEELRALSNNRVRLVEDGGFVGHRLTRSLKDVI